LAACRCRRLARIQFGRDRAVGLAGELGEDGREIGLERWPEFGRVAAIECRLHLVMP
jgi:hypothetical protein